MPNKGDVHVVPSEKGWRVQTEGTGGASSTIGQKPKQQERRVGSRGNTSPSY
jgi:hypothetical protein